MKFECASNAAEVLGCDLEELTAAVFKHHLQQILAQARGSRPPPAEESPAGTGLRRLVPWLWAMGERGEDGGRLQGEAKRPFLSRQ